MAYLTYDEYEQMGGQLSEAAFSTLEFRASKALDALTHGRVMNEQPVRKAVKQAVYALIGTMHMDDENANAYGGRDVQSMSNDGVSVTFSAAAALCSRSWTSRVSVRHSFCAFFSSLFSSATFFSISA